MIVIHYADEHLLVVEKPAGLLTVPGKGLDKQDCLINRLKIEYPTALIVHRLDMATSGLLVVALSKKAHRLLNALFAQRKVYKSYVANVYGCLGSDKGEIFLPLICDWPNRPRQKVDYINGKKSQTYYKLLDKDMNANRSRVKLFPITGRSHQLRVHMQAIGHAIVGDKLYAIHDGETEKRLHLHAERLRFTHPINNQSIDIFSQVPF